MAEPLEDHHHTALRIHLEREVGERCYLCDHPLEAREDEIVKVRICKECWKAEMSH